MVIMKIDIMKDLPQHNVFQLAPFSRNHKINWIEPIEVWGNFRAARKAKVLEKSCGLNDDGTIWIRGTNDSHQRFGAKHTRTVFLNLSCENKFYFKVIDEVVCNKKMHLASILAFRSRTI